MADFTVRLIGHANADPGSALGPLQALATPLIGSPLEMRLREPYEKLGLYSDAIHLGATGPADSLVSLYETMIALSQAGWREEEPNRFETLREAIWDNQRATEPLLHASIAWAHLAVEA